MALFPICLLCFSSLSLRLSHPARLPTCSPASFPLSLPSARVRFFYSSSNQLLIKSTKKYRDFQSDPYFRWVYNSALIKIVSKIEISGGIRISYGFLHKFQLKTNRKTRFPEGSVFSIPFAN